LLHGKEHHHLKNVARIKPGESVWLVDESGQNYQARVEKIEKNLTRLSILAIEKKTEPRVKVTLGQALIKTRNFELILQKATEIGLSQFLPVIASRSMVKIDDKLDNRMARWAKIAREAAKQSGVFQVPAILWPKSLKEVIGDSKDDRKIFLNEREGKPLRHILVPDVTNKNQKHRPSSVLVLIGPEGGWTEEEEEDIVSHGFEAISLGCQILRAETAAIGSLAMIDHFWNQ
jgi:16S rRNA (uracil1498-N3)-methyltransferase